MPRNEQRATTTIAEFLARVGHDKAAEAYTEPGSIGGPTEHPVKDVDDGTEAASEGERSAENEQDVKEDQGPPSVDSRPEAKAASFNDRVLALAKGLRKAAEGGAAVTPGSAEDDQLQIGTRKAPTGEDPKNETASAKGGKDDPGSTHPARTDNDALDGYKYAFDADTPLEKLAAALSELGNSVLADLVVLTKQAAEAPAEAPAQPPAPAPQALEPKVAEQLGWELAGLLDGSMDKRAADAMVQATLQEVIKHAHDLGHRTADVLDEFFKQAEGDPEGGHGGPDAPAGPPGGGAPGGGMPGGGMPGGDEAALMAALGGGGGAPAGPGGAPGGAPGGGGEEAMLAQLLAQAGITPEELEQALAAEAGGGMGGDAAGGGMPAPAAPAAPAAPPMGAGGGGMEVAAADREKMSGAMAAYIREIAARSRARSQRA